MRRILRIVKFATLGLFGLIGIGLIGLALANASTNSQIKEKVAKLRAAGEPVTIADLAANPPESKDNAATFLDLAEKDCLAIQGNVDKVWEQEEMLREKAGVKLDESFYDDPAMVDTYRTTLARHPKVIGLLNQAAECPRYQINVNYKVESPTAFLEEMLEKISTERAAIRVLNYRVRLLLADGKPEEALETCLVMLRLSNLCAQAPALVGQLVAIACRSVSIEATGRVLQSDQLSPEARQRLDAELSRQEIRSAYRNSFRTERAVGLDHFADARLMLVYTGYPHGKQDQLSYLELFDLLIANADRPLGDPQAKAEMRVILDRAGPLTKLLAPAIQATDEAVTRNEAQVRCLRVLNALLARGIDEAKEVQLSELRLPLEATTDPFTGKPLHLKRTGGGWLVYSVGKNLKDDGGQLDDEQTDVGLGPFPQAPER